MNEHLKALTGLGFAGLIALFALHGSALLETIAKIPALLDAFTKSMPLGVFSFLLALIVTSLVYWFLDRWLPTCKIFARRSLLIESFTLFVGIGVMLAQQTSSDRAAMLQTILVGIIVGLGAPLTAKFVKSFARKNP